MKKKKRKKKKRRKKRDLYLGFSYNWRSNAMLFFFRLYAVPPFLSSRRFIMFISESYGCGVLGDSVHVKRKLVWRHIQFTARCSTLLFKLFTWEGNLQKYQQILCSCVWNNTLVIWKVRFVASGSKKRVALEENLRQQECFRRKIRSMIQVRSRGNASHFVERKLPSLPISHLFLKTKR